MTDMRAVSMWVGEFIQSQTADQVDTTFKNLGRLSEGDRKVAVDTVEKMFVEEFLFLMPAMTQNMGQAKELIEQFKDKTLMEEFNKSAGAQLGPLGDFLIDIFHRQTQAAWHINEIQKDKADPVIKTLVSKAADLSEDEYNSVGGVLSVLLGTMSEHEDRKPKGGPGFGFGGSRGPGFGPGPGGRGPKFGGGGGFGF